MERNEINAPGGGRLAEWLYAWQSVTQLRAELGR
jgi:hypothetical protein